MTMDLSARPYVLNRDGSHSTIYSENDTAPAHDGTEMLYPRVADDGRFMSSDEAYESGAAGQHMGIYQNRDQAESGAQAIHNYYDANPPKRTRSVYSGIIPEQLGASGQPVRRK